MIAMPLGIGKKRSKPQVQQQASAPAPATAPPPPAVPADWAAILHPTGPKGRFEQGQNAKSGYRR